jgi:serine protease Do
MFTTDIYGSKNATGIIVDLRGEVLGIIDQSLNTEDAANLISALGISDIKKDIERMSNGKAKTYLGVKGVDVSKYANQSQGVPTGAFVKEIVMGSPAMNAGIQSGDVIVELGGREINKYSDLLTALGEKYPGTTVTVKVMRQGGDSYQEIDLEITLGQN